MGLFLFIFIGKAAMLLNWMASKLVDQLQYEISALSIMSYWNNIHNVQMQSLRVTMMTPTLVTTCRAVCG